MLDYALQPAACTLAFLRVWNTLPLKSPVKTVIHASADFIKLKIFACSRYGGRSLKSSHSQSKDIQLKTHQNK